MRITIRDFFVFRGILFVSGEVGPVHMPTKNIFVLFDDGHVEPLSWRPNSREKSSDDYLYFEGDLRIGTDLQNDQIAKLALIFEDQQSICTVEKPTHQANIEDKFLTSGTSFWKYLNGLPAGRILEIGSRARSGIVRKNEFPDRLEYIGLDICAGPNVTLVGDVHSMSTIIPKGTIDAVFSVSVWEHLSMPWLASIELNRVMKRGALAMINTHQSWPYHEGPWDYFRYSDSAWDGLFNHDTGFEIIERGMGHPCVMTPSIFHAHLNNGLDWQKGFLASRVVVRKIGDTQLTWPVDPLSVSPTSYSH